MPKLLKILYYSIISIISFIILLLVAFVVWSFATTEYGKIPMGHIRNDHFMVAHYQESFGFGTSNEHIVMVVNLKSKSREERFIASVSTYKGHISKMEFVDSSTIRLSVSGPSGKVRGEYVIDLLNENETLSVGDID